MREKLFTSLIASLILGGAVAGCTDSPTELQSRTSADVGSENSPVATPERARLTQVTRALAIALGDRAARNSLKEDMRRAPFREHKLEVRKYIREDRGAKTRDALGKESGRSGAGVVSLLDSIRPLELYMPVQAQRESWDGAESPIVVSQLAESDEIVAFGSDGKAVTLSRSVPPSQPVIALIPVETRFDQPLDPGKARNVNDKGGKTVGTLERCGGNDGSCVKNELTPGELHKVVACDAECDPGSDGGGTGGGAGGGTDGSGSFSAGGPGLYLEFSRLLDAKEPWFRGDPEIEVHVQGPTDTGDPQYGADLSCSGEHAFNYAKVFDQNGNFWNGSVLLFSKEELDNYNSKFPEGFHVMFWEDDDTPCTIKTDSNPVRTLIEQSAKGAGGAAAVKIDGRLGYVVRAATFLASLFSNASWLLTNDDFLGVAVDMTQLGEWYPDATHDIMIGGASNGRARLVYK